MTTRRPTIWGGLFVAAALTAALIGTFFFAWRVAGLPFVPFDIFDLQTRVLPGRIIAFGIGSMVTIIRALNLGPTSTTAKTAELRTPLSQLSWVIWRYGWPYQPGKHTFAVRCYDGNGTPQIAIPSPPEPNGATGLNSRSMML